MVPFPFCNNYVHFAMILSNRAETIKADRLHAVTGDARRKTNAREEKKPLLREKGPIAKSYSNPRNKVLAQPRRKRDGCNRMNTLLIAVRRGDGARDWDLEAGPSYSGVPGSFSSWKQSP
jgi:hypothetical protein